MYTNLHLLQYYILTVIMGLRYASDVEIIDQKTFHQDPNTFFILEKSRSWHTYSRSFPLFLTVYLCSEHKIFGFTHYVFP